MEKTPSLLKRIDQIVRKIAQYESIADPDELFLKIEIGRITRHHRKGIVYRAEINITRGKRFVRAKAAAGDVVAALDEAKDEIEQRFLKEKRKIVSVKHREGVRMKKAARL